MKLRKDLANEERKIEAFLNELVRVIMDMKGPIARVLLRNRLDTGDPVEYLTPGLEERLFNADEMKSAYSMSISSARNEDIIYMQVPQGVRINDLIRRDKRFREAKLLRK